MEEFTTPEGQIFWAKVKAERITDAVIQSRCDSRTLAVFADYFWQQGLPIRSVAELVRLSLEYLRELLVNAELVADVMSVDDAVHFLSRLGLDRTNPRQGRGSDKLRGLTERMRQQQRENMQLAAGADPRKSLTDGRSKQLIDVVMREIRETAEAVAPSVISQMKVEDDGTLPDNFKEVMSRVPRSLIAKEDKEDGDSDESSDERDV